MDDFKVPSSVPQDLLLIQEIVGLAPTEKKEEKIVPPPPVEDDINSSDSEAETESVKTEILEEPKIEKPPAEEAAVYVFLHMTPPFMNGSIGLNPPILRQTSLMAIRRNQKPKLASRKYKPSMKM